MIQPESTERDPQESLRGKFRVNCFGLIKVSKLKFSFLAEN